MHTEYIEKIKKEYIYLRSKKDRTDKENETMNFHFQRLVIEDNVPNGSSSIKKESTRISNPFIHEGM